MFPIFLPTVGISSELYVILIVQDFNFLKLINNSVQLFLVRDHLNSKLRVNEGGKGSEKNGSLPLPSLAFQIYKIKTHKDNSYLLHILR